MSETILGTCSICGGAVTVPTFWSGIISPVPTCKSCGAVKADSGPIIQMRPRVVQFPAIDSTGQKP